MEIKQFKKLEIFGNAYQIEYGTQYQIDHHKYGKIKKHYHTTTTHTIQNKTLDNLIKTNNPINKDATIKEIKLDQFNKTITITRHNEIKINKETFQTKEEITIKPNTEMHKLFQQIINICQEVIENHTQQKGNNVQ